MPDPFTVSGLFVKPIYAVAALPSAATYQGSVMWVNDLANTDNPAVATGKIAAGGGTTAGRVRSDGTVWRVYGWS